MNAQILDLSETMFGGNRQAGESDGSAVDACCSPAEQSPVYIDPSSDGSSHLPRFDESSAPITANETKEGGLDDDLMYLRLRSLLCEPEESNASLNAKPRLGPLPSIQRILGNRILVMGFVGMFGLCCGFSGFTSFLVWRNATNSDSSSVTVASASPTQQAYRFPATWTPTPTLAYTSTPVLPSGKAKASLIVRAGPGQNYAKLGTMEPGSKVSIVGRTQDCKYLAIAYPYSVDPGWVATDVVDFPVSVNEIPAITYFPLPVLPTKAPVVIAALPAKPTPTPTPLAKIDFELGRQVDFIADCGQAWKVAGTTYGSSSGSRQNGVLVRITAFSQLQGIVTSGVSDYARPGYWEWNFNRSTDLQGNVTIVNTDGTLRFQPVPFHLTSKCDGAGAVNQVIMDFVAKH